MENQLLISMLGSSAMQKGREGAKEASATDSRGFSNCLEEATSDSQETETDLISAKESKEEIKERQKAEQADAQAQAKAAQAKLAQNPKAMSGKAFLYDMIYRNPDTLNMAEKQALKLDTAQKNARLNPNHKAGQNLNSTPTLAQAPGKEASQLKAQTFEALLTKEGKGKEDSSKLGTVEANQAASAANKGQGAENAASIKRRFGLGDKFTQLTDNLRAVLGKDGDTVLLEVKAPGDPAASRIARAWAEEYAPK